MPTWVWLVAAFLTGAWLNPTVPSGLGMSADGAAAPPRRSTPSAKVRPGEVAGSSVGPEAAATPTVSDRPELPACRYADDPAIPDREGTWVLARIDTIVRLPEGYRPNDLVPVSEAGLAGGSSVRSIVLDDLRDLGAAAAAAGRPLAVQSGFRSEARQATVYAGWVASSGKTAARRFSARAGHSEHQLGTAVDFRAVSRSAPWFGTFEETPAGRWLAANASQYGFVMSYPKGDEDVSCYGYEPWHFRWIGRDAAARFTASGKTLRSWLWAQETAD